MSYYLGEPPETFLGRTLRYLGYFLFGIFLGLVPASWKLVASAAPRIEWRTPCLMLLGSGVFFLLLGIVTRGRALSGLLRFFGKHLTSRGP